MDDWYRICSDDIHSNYGSSLLLKYDNSPAKMVMGTLVDHPWQVWKFAYPPRNIWNDKKTVDEYMTYHHHYSNNKSKKEKEKRKRMKRNTKMIII